jgi:predicted  nucleic acid-binding Zn-ribbon protein
VREEFSVAFDFQKPALDDETPYAVTLQPGLGQLRAFEILPASAQAMVVRLGFDEGFIDALTESGVMKVQIAEKKSSYEVKDFAAGLNDLDSCLQEDLADAGKGAQTQEPFEAKTEEKETEILSGAAAELLAMEPAGAGKAFKARKLTAAPALPAAEVEIASTEDIKAEEAAAIKPASGEMGDEKPEVSAPPVQVKAAAKPETPPVDSEALLKAEEKPAIAPKTVVKATVAKAEAKEEKSSTAAAEEQQAKSAPAEPPVEPKVHKLSSEDARILANAKAHEQQNAELRRKNDALLNELAQTLSSRDEAARQDIAQAMKRAAEMESKLAAAQEDNRTLSAKLEDALLVKEDERVKAAAGDETLEKLTARLNEAERNAQRTAQDLERERTSCSVKTAKLEEMLFDPAVTDRAQQDKLSVLEQELALAQEKLKNSQSAIDERVAEIRKQIEEQNKGQGITLQQKISALETELTAARQAQTGAQQKIASLEAEASALKTKAEGSAAEAAAGQILKEGNQKLSSEIAALKVELAAAQLALKEEQTKPDLAPELQQKAQSLEGTIAALNVEKKALEDENTLMTAELSKLRLQAGEIQASEAGRADRLASLKIENDRLKYQLGLKEKESAVFRNEATKLQQELAQTRARAASVEAKASQDVSGQEALKTEVDALRSQVTAMERQHHDTVTRLQSDRQKLEQALARTAPAAAPDPQVPARQVSVPQAPVKAVAQAAASQPVYEAEKPVYDPVYEATPAAVPVAAAVAQAALPAPQGFSQQALEAMLSNAGIAAEGVRRIAATGSQEAFAWTAGGLNGRGVVQATSSFSQAVETYIASLKQSCGGDFASIPTQEGRGRSSYEIACITPQDSRSSSVLFFEKEGRFVAISHETDAADMDIAMDARDRLMGQVAGLTSAAW